MKILKRYIIPALVWVLVVVYVVFAARMSRERIAQTVVGHVDIAVADSTADKRLVTSRMVREWLLHSGISTIGTPMSEVDFTGIEKLIARNGFVDKAVAYAATDGTLYIRVRQRQPAMRLMTDGYDLYTTHDGLVFGTPAASTVYVPVITGSYRPPFPPAFEGNARSHTDTLIYGNQGISSRISELKVLHAGEEKRLSELSKKRKAVKNSKLRKGFMENDEAYESRNKIFAEEKAAAVQKIEAEQRAVRAELKKIEQAVEQQQAAIKKEEKKYEDFLKLLNFVEWIENDDFWRAEIVQIIVDTTPGGAMAVELVPRSGAFTIEFGEPENADGKFARLLRFYRHGLNNIGWDRYSSINVACEGQVICRK